MTFVEKTALGSAYHIRDVDSDETLLYAAELHTLYCCNKCTRSSSTVYAFDVQNGEPNTNLFVFEKKPSCCSASQIKSRLSEKDSPFFGSVQQRRTCGSCCIPTFDMRDQNEKTYTTLRGNSCCIDGVFISCCNQSFSLTNSEKKSVGKLSPLFNNKKKRKELEKTLIAPGGFLMEFNEDLEVLKLADAISMLFLIDGFFSEYNGSLSEWNCCSIYLCGIAWMFAPITILEATLDLLG